MSKHKFTKVGESLFYKEGIYEYRGAKIWCETKKVKNPYGAWRYSMHVDVNGEEIHSSNTANTRKLIAASIDQALEEYGVNSAKGFKVY